MLQAIGLSGFLFMQHAFSRPDSMSNWCLCAQCGSEVFQNANSVPSKISPKVQSPGCTVHLRRMDPAKSGARAVKPQRARAGLFRPAALGMWLGNHLSCPRALLVNGLTRCAFADLGCLPLVSGYIMISQKLTPST